MADRKLEIETLARTDVLNASLVDVGFTRERVRLRRLARLAVVLAPVAGFLWLRILSGNPVGFGLPKVSAEAAPFIPGAGLIVLFTLVMVVPLVLAGRSPHVRYRANEIEIGLDDVRGAGVVKEEIVRTLNIFLAHKMFKEQMGGTPRRGVLFEGPPGTGKTYMAKAMARDAGVPFLFVSSSAFQSMYYGQTNRKIRSYFRALRATARKEGGAIGFIEEIDAIGGARAGMSGSTQREGVSGVVNELLIQLQSFDEPTTSVRLAGVLVELVNRFLPAHRQRRKPTSAPANILVIGATNRSADLDPALLRPGRFDRSIHFGLPGRRDRREIIDYYLDRKAHDKALDEPQRRDTLAAMTAGYSPVMIEHLFDEALVWALRQGAGRLGWEDLQRAKMTTEIGLEQPVDYTADERRRIATHEAGHATVAYLVGRVGPDQDSPWARKLEVLSIIKRAEALGLLAHSDSEERFMRVRSELDALMAITMGGLVAETLYFGEISSGPSGDLFAATTTAAQMVGSFGMGGSLISYDAAMVAGAGNIVAKVLAHDAAREQVEEMLEAARKAAEDLITAHQHILEALRDALLDREQLVGDEILDVIRAAEGTVLDIDLRDEVRGRLSLVDELTTEP